MKLRMFSLAGLTLAAGCATTANPSNVQPELASVHRAPQTPPDYPPPMTSFSSPPSQREFSSAPAPMQMATQGWFGVSYVDTRDVDVSSGAGNITDIDVDSANMPVIGGVFMKPFAGNKLQLGLEGGLNMGWQGNVNAVAIGGGGAAISADTDVFLFDLFGGPYVSWFMSPKARLYLAAGFTFEWASFDYDIGASHIYEDGFGDGYYARTGLEMQVSPGTWVGLGVRRVDSSLDPGGRIDNVDLLQMQYLFTVTHSM